MHIEPRWAQIPWKKHWFRKVAKTTVVLYCICIFVAASLEIHHCLCNKVGWFRWHGWTHICLEVEGDELKQPVEPVISPTDYAFEQIRREQSSGPGRRSRTAGALGCSVAVAWWHLPCGHCYVTTVHIQHTMPGGGTWFLRADVRAETLGRSVNSWKDATWTPPVHSLFTSCFAAGYETNVWDAAVKTDWCSTFKHSAGFILYDFWLTS